MGIERENLGEPCNSPTSNMLAYSKPIIYENTDWGASGRGIRAVGFPKDLPNSPLTPETRRPQTLNNLGQY